MVRTFFFKRNIDSLVAAIAGFLIIFFFTRHGGIGVDPDGVVYLTSAENLATNGNLADFAHKGVVEFPAFYPIFLSGITLITGLQPLVFAPFLNAFLFALLIYLSGFIMEHFEFSSRWYKRILLTCIVLNPGLLEVYSTLWSETLFILLLLIFMILMYYYFQSHARGMLVAAAASASLAAVTRYAGVTFIATGALLLLFDNSLPLRRRLINLALYSALSPLLLIINLVRNYKVSATTTGAREMSITALNVNMHDAGSVFYDWMPFPHGNYTGAAWIVFFLIAVLTWMCIKHFSKDDRVTTYESIAVGFSLIHIVFMIVTASISRFETLNSRFMSPVFIPLMWSGSSWIVPLIRRAKKAKRLWLSIFGLVIFLGFQYKQLAADYETWDGVKDAGIPGYTEDQWRYSQTVLFIQKDSLPFRPGYTIYSDANDAIYFFTGREGKFLPHKEDDTAKKRFLNDHHCYVVWFNDGENTDLVSRDFILRVKKMKVLRQFNDGTIYESDE